jgi:outer membrane protein assembly factor BamD (BamD/ComL family)
MKIRYTLIAAAIAACLFASCSHIPKSIPEDMSAKEIVQKAQEASDAYHYDAAVVYYRTLNERYGSDLLYRTTAEYEIAFIAYKQKRYTEAKAGLEKLLEEYSGPDAARLPPRYMVLCKKVLERIDEKLKEAESKAKPPKADQAAAPAADPATVEQPKDASSQ